MPVRFLDEPIVTEQPKVRFLDEQKPKVRFLDEPYKEDGLFTTPKFWQGLPRGIKETFISRPDAIPPQPQTIAPEQIKFAADLSRPRLPQDLGLSKEKLAPYIPPPKEPKKFSERVKLSWEQGVHNVTIGELRAKQIFDGIDTEPEIQKLKRTRPQYERKRRSLPEEAVRATAEMVPLMLESLKQSAKKGAVVAGGFAGITALAGQAGPQVMTPEEAVTVPVAAGMGYGVGSVWGAGNYMMRAEAGLAYDEMLESNIDPKIAKPIAKGVGVVNAVLELAQINTLLSTIPGGKKILMGNLNKGIAKKAAQNPTIRRILLKAGTKYAGTIATETTQELGQEITTIVGNELGKHINNSLLGTKLSPSTKKQIADRLIETAIQSALAFSVMGLPGHIVTASKEAAGKYIQERGQKLKKDIEETLSPTLAPGQAPVAPTPITEAPGVAPEAVRTTNVFQAVKYKISDAKSIVRNTLKEAGLSPEATNALLTGLRQQGKTNEQILSTIVRMVDAQKTGKWGITETNALQQILEDNESLIHEKTAVPSPTGIPQKAAAKEPWQMSKNEFIEDYYNKEKDKRITWKGKDFTETTAKIEAKKLGIEWTVEKSPYTEGRFIVTKEEGKIPLEEYKKEYGNDLSLPHKQYIVKALSQGKPVPPEVLKDYPELAKPAPAGSGKAKAEQAPLSAEEAVKQGMSAEEWVGSKTKKPDSIKFVRKGDAIGREYHETITAVDEKTGNTLGSVDYVYLDKQNSVKMIEVKPKHRREKIATALLNEMQSGSDNPIDIVGNYMTDEGKALFAQYKTTSQLLAEYEAAKAKAAPAVSPVKEPLLAEAKKYKTKEAFKPVVKEEIKPGGIAITEALHKGKPVSLPKGANAVKAIDEAGKKTIVLYKDIDTLRGAGPFKSVTSLTVAMDNKGRPKFDEAKVVKGEIKIKGEAGFVSTKYFTAPFEAVQNNLDAVQYQVKSPIAKSIINDFQYIDIKSKRKAAEWFNIVDNFKNVKDPELLSDIIEGKKIATDKETNIQIKKIKTALIIIYRTARKVGVQVKEIDDEGNVSWRPIGQIKGYLPREINPEIREKLDIGLKDLYSKIAELKNKGIRNNVKEALLQEKKEGNSYIIRLIEFLESKEMKTTPGRILKLLNKLINRDYIGQYGHLERPRTANELPPEFYERNAVKLLARYFAHSARRIAEVEKFGTTNAKLLSRLRMLEATNPEEGAKIRQMVNYYQDKTRHPMSSNIATAISTLKIGLGTSTIPNITQTLISTIPKQGVFTFIKGGLSLFNPHTKELLKKTGLPFTDVIHGLYGYDPEGILGKTNDVLTTVTGFKGINRLNALLTASSTERWVKDVLLPRSVSSNKFMKSLALDNLKKLKIEPEDIINGKIKEDKLIDAMLIAAQNYQLFSDITNEPLLLSDPKLRWLFILKRFGYKQVLFTAHEIIYDELLTHANPLPLLRLLAGGLLGGAFVIWAKNKLFDTISYGKKLVTGKTRKKPYWLKDKEDFTTWQNAVDLISQAGALGMISDLVRLDKTGNPAIRRALEFQLTPVIVAEMIKAGEIVDILLKSTRKNRQGFKKEIPLEKRVKKAGREALREAPITKYLLEEEKKP